jgi:hypothetical protein
VHFKTGIGVKNELQVGRDSENNQYVVYVNGYEEDRFADATEPRCTGDGNGVAAVLTSAEQFPGIPVKVRYEIYE